MNREIAPDVVGSIPGWVTNNNPCVAPPGYSKRLLLLNIFFAVDWNENRLRNGARRLLIGDIASGWAI